MSPRLGWRPTATSSCSALTAVAADLQDEPAVVLDPGQLARRPGRRPPRRAAPGPRPRPPPAPPGRAAGRSASTSVTRVPNRANAWASSHADRAAPEHDQRRRRLDLAHHLAVGPVRRAGQPVHRRHRRLGAGVEHDPEARDVRRAVDVDPTGTGQPTVPADDPDPGLLERAGVLLVVPVMGGLADPGRGAGQPLSLVRGVDHQLRRRAAPERALATHQVALDADHREPGLGELARGVLTACPEPEDDDVDGLLSGRDGGPGRRQDRSASADSMARWKVG